MTKVTDDGRVIQTDDEETLTSWPDASCLECEPGNFPETDDRDCENFSSEQSFCIRKTSSVIIQSFSTFQIGTKSIQNCLQLRRVPNLLSLFWVQKRVSRRR